MEALWGKGGELGYHSQLKKCIGHFALEGIMHILYLKQLEG